MELSRNEKPHSAEHEDNEAYGAYRTHGVSEAKCGPDAQAGDTGIGARPSGPAVLFCDLDGTLLGPDHRLDARTSDAVRAAVAAGWTFCPATGRMPAGTLPIVRQLNLACPMVCLGGSFVVDQDNEVICSRTLSADVAHEVLNTIERLWPRMEPSYFAGWDWFVFDPTGPATLCEQRIVGTKATGADLHTLIDRSILPNKIFCSRSEGFVSESLQMAQELARHFPDVHVIRSASGLMVEIMPAGVNKASGAQALLDHLGAKAADAVAFGDDENDVALLRLVGTGVAVANASGDALRASKEHTASNAQQGVATWIEERLLP